MMTKEDTTMAIWGVIIGLAFAFLGFFMEATFVVVVGIIIAIIPAPILFFSPKKSSDNVKILFYNKCIECDVTDVSSDTNKEKAKIVARTYSISYGNDIEKFFNKGKELSEKLEQDGKLVAKRRVEGDKYILLTKYSSERGRNKRVAMLIDLQKSYEANAQSLKSAVGTALAGEKEIDWATHGGIASAIAGGAAGVAVASDIQAKNAQIRARNEANRQAMMPAVKMVSDSIIEYQNKAKSLQKEIEAAKVKLVATTPAEEVLSYLDIKTNRVEISETGAFTVSATIKLDARLNHGFYVLDKLPAVVDGVVSADLYQEGVKVGNALLVLPLYGIGNQTTIEGICLSGAKRNVPYEVKYTAYRLWAMER